MKTNTQFKPNIKGCMAARNQTANAPLEQNGCKQQLVSHLSFQQHLKFAISEFDLFV